MPIRALAVVLVCAGLVSAQPAIPETSAGRLLTAWLTAFYAGDAAALQAFDAAHRPDALPVSVTMRSRSITGGFSLIKIEKSNPVAPSRRCWKKGIHAGWPDSSSK
jgi:hypothetical protein